MNLSTLVGQKLERYNSLQQVERSKLYILHIGGFGGFSLACEDFGRMFDNSLPAYALF